LIYERNNKKKLRESVQHALESYAADIKNVAAGYDVLRYASQGLVLNDIDCSADPFVEWYPRDPGYIILRLAAEKKLKINESILD